MQVMPQLKRWCIQNVDLFGFKICIIHCPNQNHRSPLQLWYLLAHWQDLQKQHQI